MLSLLLSGSKIYFQRMYHVLQTELPVSTHRMSRAVNKCRPPTIQSGTFVTWSVTLPREIHIPQTAVMWRSACGPNFTSVPYTHAHFLQIQTLFCSADSVLLSHDKSNLLSLLELKLCF